ncbi:CDP-glucose 4,6-dehydratase, partial [Pelagibacteraceae bacterium]|nr:CDP-glucose 4,6-dehydratase [Pelagibacteraceae bacterium]
MENMGINKKFWKNKKVFITGHTGFKGSWLVKTLLLLDCKIIGYSNNIPTNPSLFKLIKSNNKLKNINGDVRDANRLKKVITNNKPDIIIHLAAQPIVQKSFEDPFLTFASNITGTINLLEIIKNYKKKILVLIITSDKTYEINKTKKGLVETDPLGGEDPYSASKSCCDIIVNSYYKSFFKKHDKIFISSARAGNVVGGGDWSPNRIITDIYFSITKSKKLLIRNPNSIRPWQYVMDVIYGYLLLIQKMNYRGHSFCGAWNFGPKSRKNFSVSEVIEVLSRYWKKINWEKDNKNWKQENNY